MGDSGNLYLYNINTRPSQHVSLGGADPEWCGEDAGGQQSRWAQPLARLQPRPFSESGLPRRPPSGPSRPRRAPSPYQPSEKHRSEPAPYPSAKEALLQLQGGGWAGGLDSMMTGMGCRPIAGRWAASVAALAPRVQGRAASRNGVTR
jgi:hypothetical protein